LSDYLWRQLDFAREQTLKAIASVTEDEANIIHAGFRNHIRWNVGHIYHAQDRLAFHFLGLPLTQPTEYAGLFAMGTSPLNWTQQPPSMSELIHLLSGQQLLIRTALAHRLDEKVEKPFTTSAGLYLETVRDILSFTLYHEGMHFSTIKVYKALSAHSER
jgi:hypothetical protein